MGQGQPPTFEREPAVDDNHREIGLAFPTSDKASETRDAVRQGNDEHLESLLFQQLRHVRNRIDAEPPFLPHVVGKFLCAGDVAELDWAWYRTLPFRAVEI